MAEILKLEEMKEEEMYCFVAPDGSAQPMTLAPDFAMCMAVAHVMQIAGLGQSPEQLFEAGFEILPVKLTLIQNGTAQEGYERSRNQLLQEDADRDINIPFNDADEVEVKQIEERTVKNLELIGSFVDHLKMEGIEIPEAVVLSYFNG